MTNKYMIKLYSNSGKLIDTWFVETLKEAEKIRKEWAEKNNIKNFGCMPTIWKKNWKIRGYERLAGY